MKLELLDENGKPASPARVAEIKMKLMRSLVTLRAEDCRLAALRVRIAIALADLEQDLEGLGVDVRPSQAAGKSAGQKIETFAQLMEKLTVQ